MKRCVFYMSPMVVISLLLVACTPATSPTEAPPAEEPTVTRSGDFALPATERVRIRWFVGVGTGRTPDAVDAAKEFVQKFNDSQEEIALELEVVTSSTHDAIDRLIAEVEAGDPPDVIAPADLGWAGEQLPGRILPLDNTLYDLTDVDPKALDAWRVEGELVGLPAGTFTSIVFYNRDLFDEAKLPYPPHKFGEAYADGDPWTVEKMEAIALTLTRDINGKDATAPDFDPNHTAQWGFHWQWDSTRSMAVMFGAGSVVDADGDAVIPQPWRKAFHWYYEGMWQKHFIPTAAQVNAMRGDPFMSGRVAMVHTFMWYAPRLVRNSNWDVAAVPAYKGTITTRMELNGIFVLNTTQCPAEAFEVAYAIATDSGLLLAWEMLPTSRSMRPQFVQGLKAKHPGVDWQVMLDSTDYADTTYESSMPNHRKSYDRLLAFRDLMGMQRDLSLDAEMDKLELDLQVLFEETP